MLDQLEDLRCQIAALTRRVALLEAAQPALSARPGLTKKQLAEATGRSVPTINRDAADPNCPLEFTKYEGQRALLVSPEAHGDYLRWLDGRKKPAALANVERRLQREEKKRNSLACR